jgi:hypothetical protein
MKPMKAVMEAFEAEVCVEISDLAELDLPPRNWTGVK